MRFSVILVLLGQVVSAMKLRPAGGKEDTLDDWAHKVDAERDAQCTEDKCLTQIISIGGVGTKGIVRELGPVLDPLHVKGDHTPFGRMGSRSLKRMKRVLYLHGDITHAILSLNRRGWLNVQAQKVHSIGPLKDMTLEEYARTEGDDFFQVDKHFYSWKDQCKYDVAFLDTTQKTDYISELAAFLEVPDNQLQQSLRPWKFTQHIEDMMLEQKDYSNYTEELYDQALVDFEARHLDLMKVGPRGWKLMAGDPLAWKRHYSNIPTWVIEAFQEKFANVTAAMQKLGGLYIQKATCAEP